jgi:hypothetical protein
MSYGFEKVPNFLYDGVGVRVKSGAITLKVYPSETESKEFDVHVKCENYELKYSATLYDFYLDVTTATPPVCEINVINMSYYCGLKLHNQMAMAGFKDNDYVYRSACSICSITSAMLYDLDNTGKMGAFTVEERTAMAEKVKAAGLW